MEQDATIAAIFLITGLATFVVVSAVTIYYEETKKLFGWRLTAKRARKLADKKAEKREDEDLYYTLYTIQETANRGEREIIRWELSEKEVEKLEDLGFEVIREHVSDRGMWKYTIKW